MRPTGARAVRSVITTLLVASLPTVIAATPALSEVVTVPAGSSVVVVNEFVPNDPVWPIDEFVELRNVSDQVVALGGWELVACTSPTTSQVAAVFSAAAAIPPGGHYLLTHANYTGASPPDAHYEVEMPEEGGWLLHDPWSGYSDGVGLSDGLACTEGSPAPQCNWVAGEAVTRDKNGGDTGDNSADLTCQQRTPGW